MGIENNVLYEECSNYVNNHEFKYNSVDDLCDGNFPSSILYHYNNSVFNIRDAADGCVYAEYEMNGTGSGWTTCASLDEFKRVFHAFANGTFL